MLELEKLSYENYVQCIQLKVAEEQRSFVADNTSSIIHAYLELEKGCMLPLPYVIKNDGEVIGFIMMAYCKPEEEASKEKSEYCIWRFMIDEKYQGKGYGKESLIKALDLLRTYPLGYSETVALYVEADNRKATSLYKSLGFTETGELLDNEVKLRMHL
jgi:diamine N-acetyltransferase